MRGDEEEAHSLLRGGRGHPNYTGNYDVPREQPRSKLLNPWSILGIGSAIIAFTIIVVAMSTSNDTTATSKFSDKPAVSTPSTSKYTTSYRSGAKATQYADLSEEEKKSLFEDFKSKHEKKYVNDAEEQQKFGYFKEFLSLIDQRNAKEVAAGGSAKHGVTKFADMSEEEFKKVYLNYKKPAGNHKAGKKAANVPKRAAKKAGSSESVDWTGIYTTSVKDQGYCGSCWAFSAVEQVESDSIRSGYSDTTQMLSAQQVVSCDGYDWGCDGGNTETAYKYMASSGGLTLDENYPYNSYWGKTGSCIDSAITNPLVTVDSYYTLDTEDEMIDYVLTTGPLSVCLDASEWSSYSSGILSSCGNDVDHCVQAVGIDLDESYWKVRNSWGTSWGIDGYILLKSGSNTCDITYDPTYTSVALSATDPAGKKNTKNTPPGNTSKASSSSSKKSSSSK